jgi:hypothetical protein
MKQLLFLGLALTIAAFAGRAAAADDKEEAKEALKALQEFIGTWNGTGGPDKPRPGPRDPVWKETLSWAWRFRGDDAWLTLEVKGGKRLAGGELRYLPAKNRYRFTAADPAGGRQVFEGEWKNETLRLERVDPDTKETEQLTMNTAGDGVRFIYRVGRKAQGATVYRKEYLVAATKEGESLAAREKKTECVVSGGLGTMPVVYKGETYYVCCSGCRDAFNENPEKYIAEFKAKKAGKK